MASKSNLWLSGKRIFTLHADITSCEEASEGMCSIYASILYSSTVCNELVHSGHCIPGYFEYKVNMSVWIRVGNFYEFAD